MVRYRIVLPVIFFLAFTSAKAQLNGVYTVGGSDPDYIDVQSAAGSLQWNGISGPVIFKIRPGVYSGFIIWPFTNLTGQDTVSFEAENGIASSVIINSRIELQSCERVRLHKLTITANTASDLSSVFLYYTSHCLLSYCNMTNPSGENYDDDEALVKILAPWDGGIKQLTFDSCIISSPLKTIFMSGKQTRVRFYSSILTGQFKKTTYIRAHYNFCSLTFHDYNIPVGSQYYTGNSIHIPDTSKQLSINGEFYGNTFYCKISSYSSRFYNNCFKMNVDVSLATSVSVKFYGNRCEGNFNSVYCHNSFYSSNHFLGNVRLNADNDKIWNNFFYKGLHISHGGGHWIEHNNFHPQAVLQMDFAEGTICNNNLGIVYLLQPAPDRVYNNNFVVACADSVEYAGNTPFFYNPNYVDENSDLHATNPALIHKAKVTVYSELFMYDADSVERRLVPSIGANEICMNFLTDTLLIYCADSLCLDVCLDDFEGYYWTPSNLFNDSTDSSPVFIPYGPLQIKLNHCDYGVVDSVLIRMVDSLPVAVLEYHIQAYDVQFINRSGCSDSFLWNFGDGTTSVASDPFHSYSGPGSYQGSLTVSNSFGSDQKEFSVNIVNPSANIHEKNPVRIYPVPAREKLCLDLPAEFLPVQMSIIDMQGRVVFTEIIRQHSQCLEIGDLPSGLYLANILANNRHFSHRIPVIKSD
ncbi:MAG: PKD domain-containing protein [Bacteroidota bacterium]